MKALIHSKSQEVKLITMDPPSLNNSYTDEYHKNKSNYINNIFKFIFQKINYYNLEWVLVKVLYGGLNPVDAKHLYGDKLPEVLIPSFRSFIEGSIAGIDFCGEIIDVDNNNSKYKKGDIVYGTMPPMLGSFAEIIKVPTNFINLKPKLLSAAESSALPLVALTAFQAFEDNNLKENMNVLIIGGSGGTGHVAVQVAKIKGAYVTAICSSKNKDFVKCLGADNVIVYDSNDLFTNLQNIVLKYGLFDIIFDSVTSLEEKDSKFNYYEKMTGKANNSNNLLSNNGKYIQLGGTPYQWLLAHIKRFIGCNLFPKNWELFWVRFPNCSELLGRIAEYCDKGKLKVIVSKIYKFDEESAREAFRDQVCRRTIGKIVIEISN